MVAGKGHYEPCSNGPVSATPYSSSLIPMLYPGRYAPLSPARTTIMAGPSATVTLTRDHLSRYYGATYRANGDSSYPHSHSFAPPPPTTAYQAGTSGAIPRYDPYAPPRRPAQPASVASSSAAPAPQPSIPVIRFKFSPFFKVERIVSSVVECPGASGV